MNAFPTIRNFSPDEWLTYKDLRLRALADAPDAFGSTLAREQDRADADWKNRLSPENDSSWDLPLLAEVNGEPVGLAWGRIERSNPEVANLYQMWVAPSHRRLGAGKMLLEAVINWARAKNARRLDLGVSEGNLPAISLYKQAGFEFIGEPEPFRPGSDLVGRSMRLNLGSEVSK